MRLRAITLDLDDTLWPIRPVLIQAERALAEWLHTHAPTTASQVGAEQRFAIRQQVMRDHPERAFDVSFVRREGLRRAFLAAGDDADLAEEAFQVFLAARQQVTPYPDVAQVLARWAQRFTLIAVTNGNADVHRTPLGPWFSGALNAPDLGCAKPDPRVFAAACARAGAAPHEVLHIGDDPALDVAAARAAGLHALWLKRPDLAQHHSESTEPGFESLPAIDAVLHRFSG